jgi:hypothetical protein
VRRHSELDHKELADQLDQLEELAGVFCATKDSKVYKAISSVLRIVLLGSSGNAALVADVLPQVDLPVLVCPAKGDKSLTSIQLPAQLQVNGPSGITFGAGCAFGQVRMNLNACNLALSGVLATDGRTMKLPQWLAQKLLKGHWTIAHVIKTIANKGGGAHFEPNADINAMEAVVNFHRMAIARIGTELAPAIRHQLNIAYPTTARR